MTPHDARVTLMSTPYTALYYSDINKLEFFRHQAPIELLRVIKLLEPGSVSWRFHVTTIAYNPFLVCIFEQRNTHRRNTTNSCSAAGGIGPWFSAGSARCTVPALGYRLPIIYNETPYLLLPGEIDYCLLFPRQRIKFHACKSYGFNIDAATVSSPGMQRISLFFFSYLWLKLSSPPSYFHTATIQLQAHPRYSCKHSEHPHGWSPFLFLVAHSKQPDYPIPWPNGIRYVLSCYRAWTVTPSWPCRLMVPAKSIKPPINVPLVAVDPYDKQFLPILAISPDPAVHRAFLPHAD